MEIPRISNPEKTIIISKQEFAERIAQAGAMMLIGREELIPFMLPIMTRLMSRITTELFDEDPEDFEDD